MPGNEKMRVFGVKLLTPGLRSWFNRASLDQRRVFWLASLRFRVEGKEFLLTPALQSVMNIFTAFGFSEQFCVLYPAKHRRDTNKKHVLQAGLQ
ncbi:MAG: hypothetical protein LAP87_18230 [Acidobacteriia bacterium]|nr:hypothetical protein [Terriglobia bacterium]